MAHLQPRPESDSNFCKILKSQIWPRLCPPTTLRDLQVAIEEEWARLAMQHKIWHPLLENIVAQIREV